MGKTKIMRLVLRKAKNKEFVAEWKPKEYGQPTTENIGKWRDHFNQSLLPGGINAHIGVDGWLQCKLEIYNQITQQVIAAYSAPMFESIP